MLLGIDYGTTRTVVASVDRGNYPLVSFHSDEGDTANWYPSLIATRGQEIAFGLDAVAKLSEPGWQFCRGFKRQLATLGADERVTIGEYQTTALQLLTAFLSQMRSDLLSRSNLRVRAHHKLEAMISVPANANSNQRFITMEAFRCAGFQIRGMLNEPSAAGIEYAHHIQSNGQSVRREHLVIYDLGGGTFDTSIISVAARDHEVLSSEGITQLGGEDFDLLLLSLALKQAGIRVGDVTDPILTTLLEECRQKKEALHPNTRKLTIDLGHGLAGADEVSITAAEFYEQCRPLVERTMDSVEHLLQQTSISANEIASVYLVGGSSDLPVVTRLLRERYGRLVRRSPYPHAAVAIGLAIAADNQAGYKLRERFTRNFGVWREADAGRTASLDVLFAKDTPLPAAGDPPLICTRRYHPTHNIGHFRYLECSSLSAEHRPQGDLAFWKEVYFPFDTTLRENGTLEAQKVVRHAPSEQVIEEVYSCDANGIIEVVIQDLTSEFGQSFRLRGKA